MTVSDLVFYIICTVCIFCLLFGTTYYIFLEFCKNYQEDELANWYDYPGCFLIIVGLGIFVEFLIFLLLGLCMGIDDYSLSFLDDFLKSEIFNLLLIISTISTLIAMYFTSQNFDLINLMRLKHSYYKLEGLENAKNKVQSSLSNLEYEINNNKEKKHVLEELEKNKKYLETELENYIVQMKQVEQYRTKIVLQLREKGYTSLKYD